MNHRQAHDWNLAHANIGRLRAPLDDPSMAGFADNLERINQLGWAQPGFVQHIIEPGGSPRFHMFDDPAIIMNMTVWQSVEALHAFTYHTTHVNFYKRRRDWFAPMDGPTMALWWIPSGYEPAPQEVLDRLALLAEHGPTPLAFTFAASFSVRQMLASEAKV